MLGVSALQREGIDALLADVTRCRDTLAASGELAAKRRRQALAWTWHLIDAGLRERFRNDAAVREALPRVLEQTSAPAR